MYSNSRWVGSARSTCDCGAPSSSRRVRGVAVGVGDQLGDARGDRLDQPSRPACAAPPDKYPGDHASVAGRGYFSQNGENRARALATLTSAKPYPYGRVGPCRRATCWRRSSAAGPRRAPCRAAVGRRHARDPGRRPAGGRPAAEDPPARLRGGPGRSGAGTARTAASTAAGGTTRTRCPGRCGTAPSTRNTASSLLPPALCRQRDAFLPLHPMLFAVDDDPPPPPCDGRPVAARQSPAERSGVG